MTDYSITLTKKEAEAVVKALDWIIYYQHQIKTGERAPMPNITLDQWHQLKEAQWEMDKWGIS